MRILAAIAASGILVGAGNACWGQEGSLQPASGIGEERIASAGGTVHVQVQIIPFGGARLKESVSWGKGIFKSEYLAGTELRATTSKSAYKACKFYTHTTTMQPCWLDDDGDGTFDRMAATEIAGAFKLDKPLPYERDAFKQVILYLGATADSLRFSYREFNDDLARPAFTEEMVIPRESFPQMIALKNLQVEVLSVGGMGLRYRVVKED